MSFIEVGFKLLLVVKQLMTEICQRFRIWLRVEVMNQILLGFGLDL
jgi:hypothetical protein